MTHPAPTPPASCQRCQHMQVSGGTDLTTRWRCGRHQHLQDGCPHFTPLPHGRRAEPATGAPDHVPSP